MPVAPLEEFRRNHAETIQRLFAGVDAARWGLEENEFGVALYRSAVGRFQRAANPTRGDIERYLEGLHLADLALAAACERGQDRAWVEFLARHRDSLHGTARALTGEQERAKEISDSLYAELYGLEQSDGRRRSLLEYFHGRSSLGGWLRAVVTRSFVNEYRAGRRAEAMRNRLVADPAVGPAASAEAAISPERRQSAALVQRALAQAVAELDPADRLRLAYYHLHDLTLLQIGKLLGESEATASRKLERTRQGLRKEMERSLRQDHGLGRSEIQQAIEAALESGTLDLKRELGGER